MVVRASPTPLYIQIEQELRGSIEDGRFGPMARVPSEMKLTAQFSVSRMTARKALDRLVADGVLFRQPGKGTFVSPPKIAHGPSQQLSFSAAMRGVGLPFSTRVLEAGMVRAPSSVAHALQLGEGDHAVFMRRLRIVAGEPAAIHLSYLSTQYAQLLNANLAGSLTDLMMRMGAAVDQARDTVEAVSAAEDEATLLGVPIGAPLVLVKGVGYAQHRPVRYTEALYRGDRFRFTVDPRSAPELLLELKDASDADGVTASEPGDGAGA